MPLRLKGAAPRPGEADRRYYMIDTGYGGRRVRLSSGTRDKALAAKREQLVLDALAVDPDLPREQLLAIVRGERLASSLTSRGGEVITFKTACDTVLNDPTRWGRLKTRGCYASECAHRQEDIGADRNIRTITGDDLAALQKRLLRRGLSPWTVNKKLFIVGYVLRAHVPNYLDRAPEVRLLDDSGNEREFVLTHEQEATLFGAVLARDTEQRAAPRGGRPMIRDGWHYHALFVFLVETGMRLGEALGLGWGAIDKAQSIAKLRRAETKTGKARTIPLTGRALRTLEDLAGQPSGPFRSCNAPRSRAGRAV